MFARSPLRLGAGALFAVVSGCSLLGVTELHRTAHPLNVERGDATACEEAPIIPTGDLEGDAAPADGTRIAIEGSPEARVLCNQLGCQSECCNNRCSGGYALPLPTDENPYAAVDLRSPDFVCGGTDCSSYCTPFSSEPKERYRFVGTLTGGKNQGWMLNVTSWCRI